MIAPPPLTNIKGGIFFTPVMLVAIMTTKVTLFFLLNITCLVQSPTGQFCDCFFRPFSCRCRLIVTEQRSDPVRLQFWSGTIPCLGRKSFESSVSALVFFIYLFFFSVYPHDLYKSSHLDTLQGLVYGATFKEIDPSKTITEQMLFWKYHWMQSLAEILSLKGCGIKLLLSWWEVLFISYFQSTGC